MTKKCKKDCYNYDNILYKCVFNNYAWDKLTCKYSSVPED